MLVRLKENVQGQVSLQILRLHLVVRVEVLMRDNEAAKMLLDESFV